MVMRRERDGARQPRPLRLEGEVRVLRMTRSIAFRIGVQCEFSILVRRDLVACKDIWEITGSERARKRPVGRSVHCAAIRVLATACATDLLWPFSPNFPLLTSL